MSDELDVREALSQPAAYRDEQPQSIEVFETHISWVFVTDRFAYKVKKPIRTDFLDYSTLDFRHHFCREELRLNRRYAPELYLDVVPITVHGRGLEIAGRGPVCDYAVKMQRFPHAALLSEQLAADCTRADQIIELAQHLADFHGTAQASRVAQSFGHPSTILRDAVDNLDALDGGQGLRDSDRAELAQLRSWTDSQFIELESHFMRRLERGFIRECHGDLHAGNVVLWDGHYRLFDGIEFCDGFRWIDVLSDAGFLAMDLRVRGHGGLANVLTSSYLEHTGDYGDLKLLRWYQVFRALVRAKVTSIVLDQHSAEAAAASTAKAERSDLMDLAVELTRESSPRMWITHGLSGSGKSTGAQRLVQRHGAIRIRSDVERKRLQKQADPAGIERPDVLYSSGMTLRTYERLRDIACGLLQAGYSVVVDATFLKLSQRQLFAGLAERLHVPLGILHFAAEPDVLAARIARRRAQGQDASEAEPQLLERQLEQQEPLTLAERELICESDELPQ